jgi:hypothetical protein
MNIQKYAICSVWGGMKLSHYRMIVFQGSTAACFMNSSGSYALEKDLECH